MIGKLLRSDATKPHRGIGRLEDVIVRVTTWVSLAFFAFLVAAGIVSGETKFFLEALNPAVPAATGLVMIARRDPRAIIQLVASGITVALTVGFLNIGSRSSALLGLVSMGIVGALLVRDHVLLFLTGAAVGLFATALWWNVGDWVGRERVAEALVPVLAFVFAAGLVAWLKRELLAESDGRRRAAEALLSTENQFRAAFEGSAAMMVLVDLDGRFLEVNRAGCELLGYTEQDLLDMTIADVTHPDDRETSARRAAALLSGEVKESRAAIRYLRGDGTVAHGLVSAALVTDSAGAPLHFVAHVVDTTEQHEAEQRLTDLLASRNELIASVSHELRTPLTAVMGYVRLLLEAVPGQPPADYELMLREIDSQGSDLAAIIEDLLVFAQSDTNTLSVECRQVDLRDQLTLVLESLKSEVSVDHIRVVGPRLSGAGDPIRVRQVLRNLLTNAGRYGGDAIDVEFEEHGDRVAVVVSDNGPGIPAQDRDRVFEPYQRSRPRDGLTAAIGVGLTVARRLAHLMGGDLTYEYRNGRSRFMLILPAAVVPAVSSGDAGR
jgi:PAS domain S-box-containing protein